MSNRGRGLKQALNNLDGNPPVNLPATNFSGDIQLAAKDIKADNGRIVLNYGTDDIRVISNDDTYLETAGGNTLAMLLRDTGNVEIPNGDIVGGGPTDVRGVRDISTTRVVTFDGSGRLRTGGSGSAYIKIQDSSNNLATLLKVNEGGNVEIPNGDLDILSNRLVGVSQMTFADNDGNGTAYTFLENSTSGRLVLKAGGSQVANFEASDGSVAAIGALQSGGGGPNGNGAFETSNCRIYENGSGELVAEDSAGNTTTIS